MVISRGFDRSVADVIAPCNVTLAVCLVPRAMLSVPPLPWHQDGGWHGVRVAVLWLMIRQRHRWHAAVDAAVFGSGPGGHISVEGGARSRHRRGLADAATKMLFSSGISSFYTDMIQGGAQG